MTPRLTIVIPFYRGHAYLRAAIESVIQQSTRDWVLHISDDCGSEIGTQELVESYRDDRIHYSRNPVRLGIGGNWNRCLELAETDLVTLLHADDELRPSYVEVMTTTAEQNPEAVAVFSAAEIIGPDGQPHFSLADAVKRYLWRQEGKPSIVAGRRGIEALCRGNFLMCPTACYRKSRLGVRRFSDRWQFVLDLELFARLLFDGGYFVLIPDRIYAYRRHAENTTEQHTQSLRRFEEEFSIYNHLAEVARKRVWLLAAHRADTRLLLRLNLVFRALTDFAHGRLYAASRKVMFLVSPHHTPSSESRCPLDLDDNAQPVAR